MPRTLHRRSVRRAIPLVRAIAAAVLSAAVLAGGAPLPGAPARAQDQNDPRYPRRHFRIEHPAGLTGAGAETIYRRIRDDMIAGYRLSGAAYADVYRRWPRFNKVPYRSAQHGERYINNYANDTARAYGRFEAAGVMPVGSVLVKDSFAVTESGDVFSGPLFAMEKMPRGFNPPGRDWRYTMIMPDGSLFGTTAGEGKAQVEFCVTCHNLAGKANDDLFYVPDEYRVPAAQ